MFLPGTFRVKLEMCGEDIRVLCAPLLEEHVVLEADVHPAVAVDTGADALVGHDRHRHTWVQPENISQTQETPAQRFQVRATWRSAGLLASACLMRRSFDGANSMSRSSLRLLRNPPENWVRG